MIDFLSFGVEEGLDPNFTVVTDKKKIAAQELMRSLSTPRGLFWDIPGIGHDLRYYLNAKKTTSWGVDLKAAIIRESQKIRNITDCKVVLKSFSNDRIAASITLKFEDGTNQDVNLSITGAAFDLEAGWLTA